MGIRLSRPGSTGASREEPAMDNSGISKISPAQSETKRQGIRMSGLGAKYNTAKISDVTSVTFSQFSGYILEEGVRVLLRQKKSGSIYG